ncbi:MAG: DUF2726 domain-containing protein [Oceanospirillaceae bacterium]|nr:DUF2726 domain-containing protein [Oceanospirillaceae bacterium]
MQWFNLPLASLALLLFAWLMVRLRRRQRPEPVAYRSAGRLLSENEVQFLAALEQAVGKRHRVLCKVRMAAAAGLAERLDHRQWQRAFTAIRDRHFDFLVCEAETFEPVCAVELEAHARRDPLIDRVCQEAALPLLRFASTQHYVAAEIGLQFDQLFAPEVALSAAVLETSPDSGAPQPGALLGPARPVEPNCPDCGAPMALRKTSGDFQVEQAFWLCGLKECRKRVPLERPDKAPADVLEGLVP